MNCPICNNQSRKNGIRKRKETTIQEFYCRHCRHYFHKAIETTIRITNQNINSMTEDELRSKYDNKYILGKAVLNLEKAVYVPEGEFIKRCGIKISSGYRLIVESEEFSKYRGLAPGGAAYWSHPDSIQKMKNEGILR